MNFANLTQHFAGTASCKALLRLLADPSDRHITLQGLQGSGAPMALATAASKGGLYLIILDDEDQAGYFYSDLSTLLDERRVLYLPGGYKRAVKYGHRDEASAILRTEVLSRLITQDSSSTLYVITYPEALAVKVTPPKVVDSDTFTLSVGQQLSMDDMQARLLDIGFEREDYVYEPGQFSVRGSIIDIFSYALEYPLRVDFFGNEIDSIRTFDVESQLSQERCQQAVIACNVAQQSDNMVPIWQYIPEHAVLVMKHPDLVIGKVKQTYQDGFVEAARIENADAESVDAHALLYDGQDWEACVSKYRQVIIGETTDKIPDKAKSLAKITFSQHQQPLFHKNMEMLADNLQSYVSQGYTIYILAEDHTQQDRLREILQSQDPDAQPIPLHDIEGTLHEGFIDDQLKVCCFTDHQIFDRFHRYSLRSERARGGKTSLTLKELREIEPGDYVVHIDLGIGRFEGLVRINEGGHEREVMKLSYQGGGIAYVSIHSLHKVSKYKGRDGEEPQLSRLGTGAWERLKDRTKKHIKDIARDLIRLYAQRRKEKGFRFSPDTYMQHELEASFPYEDTPDQQIVTQEVKRDMESERPMDRLICGDVGFGKTEIAVRAAFKAAADSKQVALLVPTTVLAYQHYKTFTERLKDMPVTVAYLTRAQSPAKVKEIREGLASGKIDIVIGTQKLLGKTIHFHDLGLLIIDEEQKFGVATKERLRKLRVNIDTLAMSATPIPRTLQFSLMGARDLSVLRTPPGGRLPIHTEIHTFGHEVIADAIGYEMSRDGQVFIVCNRIAELPSLEQMVHKYVSNCRVAIGHGQMPPDKLEKTIFDFINHDYDVLISTTIIENGIDIPSANTIIIVDAQRYGLSDLHQMRGRVGRSNRKAFCYLLAPPYASMTAEARRRLEAVENFSDLGSGLQIAMQDLDIRGAGNLLGAEQSGFIADLGYETYQKILSQAVTELKNDEFSDIYSQDTKITNGLGGEAYVSDCTLETDLPLYFPESYIPTSAERMELYRQLDNIASDSQLGDFRSQLIDRFGPLPPESQALLQVNRLRRLGRSLGIERIILKGKRMLLYYVSQSRSAFYQSTTFGRSLAYIKRNIMRGSISTPGDHLRMTLTEVPTVDEAFNVLTQISTQAPE